MITATPLLGSYLESFSQLEKLSPDDPSWLRKLRQQAFARFCQVGYPTTHDEDWRFTNVSDLAKSEFRLAPKTALRDQQIKPYRAAGCQLVFVNGHFLPQLSDWSAVPSAVEIGSLKQALRKNPEALEAHLGRYVDTHRDPFCALNTAFLDDGAYVHIRRGTVVEPTLYLLFISTISDTPSMNHPRTLIVAEEDTQAAIVEDYVSLGEARALCNPVTELVAGDQAVISHYLLEREHAQAFNISTLRIQQGRSANVASHSVLLGGALVRNNVHPVLAGEGGECLINGLFIGTGRQHLDNYMLVEHAAPHCGSRQFYNGILDDHAHGVFHGRIIVHKPAQKTDAKQSNRNLLLSDDAQIDTKPQLEIYADDVKCTHGATIGQIEEQALFYLRSRGIDELSARKLLLFAFASECLDRMKPGPIRTQIEGFVTGHLLNVANSVPGPGKQQAEEADNKIRGSHWKELA